MNEWIIPDPDMPIRQGDIIIQRDTKDHKIKETAIILTADCDISNKKFGHHLICLRIVPYQVYLQTTHAERKLKKALEAETNRIKEQMNRWNSQRIGGASNLSADAVIRWVRNRQVCEICQELNIPNEDKERFSLNVSLYQRAVRAMDENGNANGFTRLVAFKSVLHKKQRDECIADFIKQAQQEEVANDIFLLTSIPPINGGTSAILLREIISIPFNNIFHRAFDATTNEHFIRVGQLTPTFKYAVSQLFGALYARIGLPSEHETRKAEAIDALCGLDWDEK